MALASTAARPARNSASVETPRAQRHLDDVRLLEVEGLAELDPRHAGQPEQMIVDDRDQLFAQILHGGRLEGVDDGQSLGQHLIAHVDRDPGREVVAVGGGDGPMAEEIAVRVVEDRTRRRVLEALKQLPLVGGAMIERLPQLDAADELKGRAGDGVAHGAW